MNTIGIDHNLDRMRIRKLLAIGLFASFLTGIGDFMLGYGAAENMGNYGLAAGVLASAPNLADGQMIVGGLLFYGFGMPSYMLLIVIWLPELAGLLLAGLVLLQRIIADSLLV